MPTPTYIALANTTLSGTASNVTFSSIPSTYRDLVVVINATQSGTNGYLEMQVNNATGANYNWVSMFGRSNGGYSSAAVNQTAVQPSSHSQGTQPFNTIIHLMDYSATDKHKVGLIRHNQYDNSLTSELVRADVFRWANTAAVSSITILGRTQTFASGSNFALYGIIS